MKYAIIDIGSSIIKYKIYEVDDEKIEPIIINDESVGIISYRDNGILTEEGIDALLETLNKFKNFSTKLDVKESYYYATASLRNLKNKEEVLSVIKEKLDIDISVLTGKEEAYYSYNSIYTIDTPSEDGVLIDIGGGSSEVSIFKDKTIEKQESIPTGVLKIYYKYVSQIYPTKEEQSKILEDTKKIIRETNIGSYKKEYLYGLGRTFVVIKKLFEHIKIKEDKTNLIDINLIDIALDKFSINSKEYYKPLLQVDSERIHTVLPSLLIIKAIIEEYDIKKIYVSNITLQDGILYTLNKEGLIG